MAVQASIQQGFQALEAWSWEEARTIFDQIVSEQESADALEGLGVAAFWLDDGAAAITARDRVAVRYTARGSNTGEIMGAEPTGKQLALDAQAIYRFEDGRVVESWDAWKVLSLMEQLDLGQQADRG